MPRRYHVASSIPHTLCFKRANCLLASTVCFGLTLVDVEASRVLEASPLNRMLSLSFCLHRRPPDIYSISAFAFERDGVVRLLGERGGERDCERGAEDLFHPTNEAKSKASAAVTRFLVVGVCGTRCMLHRLEALMLHRLMLHRLEGISVVASVDIDLVWIVI